MPYVKELSEEERSKIKEMRFAGRKIAFAINPNHYTVSKTLTITVATVSRRTKQRCEIYFILRKRLI